MTANNGAISYTYDAVGNRLNRTSTIAAIPTTTSTFNTNDQLGGDTYDAGGNTTASAGKTYVYDFENRIKSVNSGQITFVYDGDGNRVAKTVGGVTTKFLVDTNNPTGYAQVVEEVVGSNVQRVYEHGHSLISQTQLISGNWIPSFYGYDGHGSVRLLTDSIGTITDTYTYDAFGNLIASTGTTPNTYLYAGEQFEASLGFYYLRARYMNSSTGRFWTMDAFEGWGVDPFSLHKYIYANNDSVNRVDPTGNFSTIETVAVASQRQTIESIKIPVWKKVIAAVLITVLVAGAIVGTGTKLEPDQRLNSMRVQLQQATNHIDSQPKSNYDPPGVLVAQMRKALEELFLRSKSLIPGRLESDYLGAIARTSIWLGEQPVLGGIPRERTGTVHQEFFYDRNKVYRVDTENSFGHNLRQ